MGQPIYNFRAHIEFPSLFTLKPHKRTLSTTFRYSLTFRWTDHLFKHFSFYLFIFFICKCETKATSRRVWGERCQEIKYTRKGDQRRKSVFVGKEREKKKIAKLNVWFPVRFVFPIEKSLLFDGNKIFRGKSFKPLKAPARSTIGRASFFERSAYIGDIRLLICRAARRQNSLAQNHRRARLNIEWDY